ncbi:Glycosyltransferase involved in cell wall bisynthesis [Streptoalloteichus tenebrarius]|uniref:Glycosyltransferase involved in cell wall bisynthesis n=1 Tax=Streptoalloteichus tenebrarius (strain ATCC 17920 / DSM 40477 / JCM 4838 / CBS 697.72 / NBRC 16177 / NCIMB 11028 / NRRL B-12390 / A12253. 1 / ISP 5477) TaxID=1933 RepID=A0ABT1HPC2_STRSD|nr:glycosyltransferase family 2 protein [Streptoalloteichus tenebrarius]MCP2257355.1 Glycosyltransferase involved in cell wall bisynthesis [Streptoalloteichus tenebrarius]BFF04268.1 glycosyltransferase family 2 protein [Streptoalloteichus tenebrarius]
MNGDLEVTVLLPCLNEAETLATCVTKAVNCLRELGVDGEVLVSDNGSTDGSQEIAERHGARVVHAPIRGYGGALLAGIENARGKYVIMGDADDSYDLANLGPFIEGLRRGHDVVMGNRFKGGIAPGAMPPLHRYLGNPVLSWLGRVLFGLKNVGDFHCGLRGFHRDRIRALNLCMPGMEFASELVVRSALAGYDIVEVPTTLRPDGRSRPPHLRTWRDGWRHLRFLLVFAPGKTLVWPGAVLLLLGLLGTAVLTAGPVTVGGVRFDIAALVYACLLVMVSVQLLLFGGCAKLYGRANGLTRDTGKPGLLSVMRLEVLLGIGLLLVVLGLVGTGVAVSWWGSQGFSDLVPGEIVRLVLPSATLIATGVVCVFSGLLASLLTLRAVPKTPSAAASSED